MNPVLQSVSLLICSNVFMTFAWYAHLKELNNKPWIIAAFVSWGITLSIFVPFSIMYLKESLRLDYLWAGLCLLGAVYFIFRGA